MPERGSFVNTNNTGIKEAGYLTSVVTYCGKDTKPTDTALATTVTGAFLEQTKATCPLSDSNRCAAFLVKEVIGDGVSLAKVESYSVKCIRPCSNGMPEVAAASVPALSAEQAPAQ